MQHTIRTDIQLNRRPVWVDAVVGVGLLVAAAVIGVCLAWVSSQ